jgi:hypothetical protein
MDNPKVLSTLSTQDTGQINIRENRGGAFICPVSCVLNADSVSALYILDCPVGFL